MKIKIFTLPIVNESEAEAELNRFLSSHRILGINQQFVQNANNSCWSFCISYQEGVAKQASNKRNKVDYKEVLSPSDFLVYDQVRHLRKQLAEAQGVPVYALFTNDQLAAMVQNRVNSVTQLQKIEGVGAGKVEKYGEDFLSVLNAAWNEQHIMERSNETLCR